MRASFDTVVLGGGVAGCVLASRLSEDPDRTVCLVESGPDYGADETAWPESVRNARALPRDDVWERHVEPIRIRARILGGSSCINGSWNTWPSEFDHAEWVERAGQAWSPAALDPYRLRAIAQMGLARPPEGEMSAWSQAGVDGAVELGFRPINSSTTEGPGFDTPLLNAADGVRRNAAFAYLDATVRARSNLTIVADATVDRLKLRAGRVQKVVLHVDGAHRQVVADQYLLSCGTAGSPAVLMRSGIGSAAWLESVGVRPEINLPGVGENLADHPGIFVPMSVSPTLTRALRAKEDRGMLYVSRTLIRAASDRCPARAWDLHILPTSGPPLFGHPPPGRYEAGVSAFVVKPHSRGHVRVRTPDPNVAPDITSGFLSDADRHDVAVLRMGLDMVDELVRTSAFAELTEPRPRDVEGDEELRSRLGTYWHPVGTCAMGSENDPASVVDADARVHGVANLRVIDASILPTPPAANTQLPVLAVAEMFAARVASQR